MDSPISVGTPR